MTLVYIDTHDHIVSKNAQQAAGKSPKRDYKFSSIREAVGIEPLNYLDGDIVRLIGETKKSQEEYRKFIYDGISEDLSDIEHLFEKEEATFGTNKFATFAKKKYVRRKLKNNK